MERYGPRIWRTGFRLKLVLICAIVVIFGLVFKRTLRTLRSTDHGIPMGTWQTQTTNLRSFPDAQLYPVPQRYDHPSARDDMNEETRHAVCRPEDRDNGKVVLAKTRKTASSTLASIIARYGYTRNLTFAMPKWHCHRFGYTQFGVQMLRSQPGEEGFDILFAHVPFNKSTIQQVMNKDAKYITILRDTVSNFYSSVNFFKIQAIVESRGDIYSPTFPLEEFLVKIARCDDSTCQGTYNGQMFDLGRFSPGSESRLTLPQLEAKLRSIEEEFDLVLIQNYFDESLVLLKKLLCWTNRDIIYVSQKVQKLKKYHPTKKHADMVREWNYEDNKLFEYFNRSLWKKIERYGPSFDSDLKEFRRGKGLMQEQCNNGRPRSHFCNLVAKSPCRIVGNY